VIIHDANLDREKLKERNFQMAELFDLQMNLVFPQFLHVQHSSHLAWNRWHHKRTLNFFAGRLRVTNSDK
jgi:hypothetical protein